MNWGNLGSMHLSDYCHAGSGCLLGKGLGVTTGTWLNKWGCIILCPPPSPLSLPPPPPSSSIPPPGSDMWYSASRQKKGLFHAWTILSTPPPLPKWHSDTHWVSDNPPRSTPSHTFTHRIVSVFLLRKKRTAWQVTVIWRGERERD